MRSEDSHRSSAPFTTKALVAMIALLSPCLWSRRALLFTHPRFSDEPLHNKHVVKFQTYECSLLVPVVSLCATLTLHFSLSSL